MAKKKTYSRSGIKPRGKKYAKKKHSSGKGSLENRRYYQMLSVLVVLITSFLLTADPQSPWRFLEDIKQEFSYEGWKELDLSGIGESRLSSDLFKTIGRSLLSSTNSEEAPPVETFAAGTEINSGLRISFLDVGQGDATLLQADGQTMLIDAGPEDAGTKVQLYLNKAGISSLDYLVCTHPDADHIGGADVILTKFPVSTFLLPAVSTDTKAYSNMIRAADDRLVRQTNPPVGQTYSFGNGMFTVLGPVSWAGDKNNNSLVILLTYGNTRFLFSWDAETKEEADILALGVNISADVLKVGHHGSNSSTSDAFLSAVNPDFAVISCKMGNDYHHPHAVTLNRLKNAGVGVFRTDEQSTITCISDGTVLRWSTEPSATWQAGK